MRIGRFVGTAAAAMAVAIGAAAAAGLPLASAGVGAASAGVVACDPNGFTFTRTLNGTQVATLGVASIDAACIGGVLTVTVVDASNAALGSGTATIAGSSAQVALSPQPTVSAVAAYSLAIVGP